VSSYSVAIIIKHTIWHPVGMNLNTPNSTNWFSYTCAVKKFIDQQSQTGIIIKQNILKVYKLDFV